MADPKPGSNIEYNPWIVAIVVSMATFMEVLDTSIANVSLRHIAGSMAASQSESTWVLTSYLVSNAIILPISGWLASVIGRKRFYMSCVALFTISSLLCGLAPSLGWLLFFRVLQGIGGGGLAPCEQSILTDSFPARLRGQAFALYGMAVVFAPAIGPTLGGWITDNYDWRWIFFINVPVGIVSLLLTYRVLHDSEAAKKEQANATRGGIKIDFLGFFLVAMGLGCLQIVLDKGQEDDWFASNFILICSILSATGIIGLVIWEFITPRPIVDLPLFKNYSFLITSLVMFAVFFVLLSTTQLLPQYVQEMLHYNATKAGLILMPGGFVIMALMPLVGKMVNIVQPKYMIMFGLFVMSAAMFNMTHFELQMSFSSLTLARMYQTIGMAFLFVPINTAAYAGLPPGKTNNASALVNLMRNLGGSFGVSVATTMLDRRSQMHQERVLTHATPFDTPYVTAVAHATARFLTQGMSRADASLHAVASIYNSVTQQSMLLSYIDVFKMLAVGSLVMVLPVLFLRRIKPGQGAHGAH